MHKTVILLLLCVLFICTLFNDAVSKSYCIALNVRMIVNNEFGIMRKETSHSLIKVLSWHLSGMIKENY
jgi:hypothetical protein